MESSKHPLIFADYVISKILKQIDPAAVPTPEDYTLMRETFRKSKGSWVSLVDGDLEHIQILKTTVKVWVASRAQQQSESDS